MGCRRVGIRLMAKSGMGSAMLTSILSILWASIALTVARLILKVELLKDTPETVIPLPSGGTFELSQWPLHVPVA